MMLDDAATDGMRRAALTLHALHRGDRAWLLQQLAPGPRRSLQRLLLELNDLRIPRDAEVIRAALRASQGDAPFSIDTGQALCGTLTQQPPRLQALLLSVLTPAHRRAVLQHWPSDRLASPPVSGDLAWTPSLRDSLLQCWADSANAPEARK